MPDEEVRLAVATAAVMIAIILMGLAVYFAPSPRYHVPYCCDPQSSLCLPCRYRTNDPVSVSDQPFMGELLAR